MAAEANGGGVLFQSVRAGVSSPSEITVEFYGIPRRRAGRAELTVQAATVAEALGAVERSCPGLAGLLTEHGLAPHFLVALGNQQFVTNLAQSLRPGDRLLLLSADAGG